MLSEAINEAVQQENANDKIKVEEFGGSINIEMRSKEIPSLFEAHESAFQSVEEPKTKKPRKSKHKKSKERETSPLITFKVVAKDFEHSILKESSENALTSD